MDKVEDSFLYLMPFSSGRYISRREFERFLVKDGLPNLIHVTEVGEITPVSEEDISNFNKHVEHDVMREEIKKEIEFRKIFGTQRVEESYIDGDGI